MSAAFLAQRTLDEWTAEPPETAKVRLDEETLHLVQEGRSMRLRPAVRFLQVADGTPDPHALVGKVKSLEQLKAMGAEHYFDSVLHGETAYMVEEGFIGNLSPPPSAAQVLGDAFLKAVK